MPPNFGSLRCQKITFMKFLKPIHDWEILYQRNCNWMKAPKKANGHTNLSPPWTQDRGHYNDTLYTKIKPLVHVWVPKRATFLIGCQGQGLVVKEYLKLYIFPKQELISTTPFHSPISTTSWYVHPQVLTTTTNHNNQEVITNKPSSDRRTSKSNILTYAT